MTNEPLAKFVRMTIQFEDFSSQDGIDEAVQRLLTEGKSDRAGQVKRANETLRKIASASPDLEAGDIKLLVQGDFKALQEEVILGAGLVERYQQVAPQLAGADFEQMRAEIVEVVQSDPTRAKLDNPVVVKADEIDFSSEKTMQVIPKAVKFILPVPAFEGGGEPLVYPPSSDKAGQPILDYENKPIGDRGIVFENRKETVAAALGDGTAVMIINDVKADQANKLKAKVAEFADAPEKLTLKQYMAVLEYARDELGLSDIYNSSRKWISENMSAVGENSKAGYGTHKRDSRDISNAIYIVGDLRFEGTSKAAGGTQNISNGALIIKDNKGEVRAITRKKAEATYMMADGKPLDRVFDVAEMEAALAQSHKEFGLKAGEVPHKNMDGEVVGVGVASNVVIAEGYEEGGRKATQGRRNYREIVEQSRAAASRERE